MASVTDLLGSVFWLVALLLLSAFCSASETAITAAGRGKLMALRETRPLYKTLFQWLSDNIQRVLTLCLITNNVITVATSALATTVAVNLFGASGMVYVISILTALIVIFGEILPKSVAIAHFEYVLLFCTPILRALDFLFYPFTRLTQVSVQALAWLLQIDLVQTGGPFVTRAPYDPRHHRFRGDTRL